MTTIEAMKQALKTFEWITNLKTGGMIQRKAMEQVTSLRQAIATEESSVTQEPKREPLTDEQISEIAAQGYSRWLEFARAIEAAHGITGETK